METTMSTTTTAPTPDDESYDFVGWARESMAEHEQNWRAAGFTTSWIDTHPKWFDITCWSAPDGYWDDTRVLADPVTPCQRTWRFSLIGGGQVRITEHWTKTYEPTTDRPVWNSKTALTVAAHTDGNLRVHHGELDGIGTEMSAHAVLLRGTTAGLQLIADRAAATLRALTACDEANDDCTHPDRDRFFALLDGAGGCSICRRPLRDEVSKLVGVGPDCARTWGIPHSRAAASKRLELRAQLLGEKGVVS
jgi:hypothetical protein